MKEPFCYRTQERQILARSIQIILFALCAFIGGCTTTDYLGKTYPPTQRADVFFSPQDVRRSYEVMGEIRAQADDIVSFQSIQQKLVQEAMQKGADAILIKNFHTIQTGFSTVENKIQEKKKSGKKSSTTVSTTQMEQAHVVTGELLKYR